MKITTRKILEEKNKDIPHFRVQERGRYAKKTNQPFYSYHINTIEKNRRQEHTPCHGKKMLAKTLKARNN